LPVVKNIFAQKNCCTYAQSKTTLANWCIDYSYAKILPIYEKTYPNDSRCKNALDAAKEWINGNVKLPYVKKLY